MTAVKALISELETRGIPAVWINTGGGCMAVHAGIGEPVEHGWRYEFLVTDREDVFSRLDYTSDDDVSGFNVGLYVYDDNGEQFIDYPMDIYRTSDDAGCSQGDAFAEDLDPSVVVDYAAEVMRTADAVEFVFRVIEAAEFAAVVDALRGGRGR